MNKLPKDILLEVSKYLSKKEKFTFSKCCRFLYSYTINECYREIKLNSSFSLNELRCMEKFIPYIHTLHSESDFFSKLYITLPFLKIVILDSLYVNDLNYLYLCKSIEHIVFKNCTIVSTILLYKMQNLKFIYVLKEKNRHCICNEYKYLKFFKRENSIELGEIRENTVIEVL